MFERITEWALINGYELATEIPENWDRYKDGCPSVTTILSLLKDRGFEFVKRMYPDQLKAACDRGTRIHGEAESFFDGGDPVINQQIMKFFVLYDVVILNKETRYTDGIIQGTIDLTAQININNNVNTLNIDYKSSNKKSKKYFIQMGGYEYLTGLSGSILYLSKNRFELVETPKYYKELFIQLKDYFFYLQELGQQKKSGQIYCDMNDLIN